MASFEIPLQELKDKGVDTDKLVRLLELIHAPQDCAGIRDAAFSMLEAARAMLSLAPSSPTLSELVSLSLSICKNKDLLPRFNHSNVDHNPMFGRYEDYPVYSLFTQGEQINQKLALGWGFQKVDGLLLATAWINNTPWHPVPPDVVKFVDELRIIRRDRLSNKTLSLVGEANSFQKIIDSLVFESKSKIITSKIIDLTTRLQEVLSHELDSQQPKATSNPNTNSETLVPELARHVNIPLSKPENPLPVQPILTQSPKQHFSVETQPPSRLDEIEKIILGDNPSADEVSTAESFREILNVLLFDECIADQLDSVLQAIGPLLPIAKDFDQTYIEVWPRWEITIRKVRDILRNSFPSPAATSNQKSQKPFNPWYGKIGKFPFITCLIADIKRQQSSCLLPAKAILLIRFYGRYKNDGKFSKNYFSFDKFIADEIRKWCNSSLFCAGMEFLPDWTGSSPAEWKASFLEMTKRISPVGFLSEYPGRTQYDVLYALKKTLSLVSTNGSEVPSSSKRNPQDVLNALKKRLLLLTNNGNDDPTNSQQNPPSTKVIFSQLPSQEQNLSLVIRPATNHYSRSRRKLTVRPSFNLFPKQKANDDADTNGLAPDLAQVVPQQDTPADQPTQQPVIQSLEVRYTNYRTAMDNQRLPWAWDYLNKFEIMVLRQALKDSAILENASASEKQGAFLVWLMLAIGQSIDQILQLCFTHSANIRGALLFGPVYRRYIHSPPHAFQPSDQQKIILGSHGQFIDLPLEPPFPNLFGELGLIDSNVKPNLQYKNIGEFLNLDNAGADKVIRQFLEQHRTRDMRLLPGRIRNVLSSEIMRVAQDPVATHLLSSLPTDMPPAGVYYTSYSEDVLRQIYDQATARIFGKES